MACVAPPLTVRPLLGRDDSASNAVSAFDTDHGSPRVANPYLEEPDALIAHVRLRGGPGKETRQVYPTAGLYPCNRREHPYQSGLAAAVPLV